eukprot:430330_1
MTSITIRLVDDLIHRFEEKQSIETNESKETDKKMNKLAAMTFHDCVKHYVNMFKSNIITCHATGINISKPPNSNIGYCYWLIDIIRASKSLESDKQSVTFTNTMLDFIATISGFCVTKYKMMINSEYPIVSTDFLKFAEINDKTMMSILDTAGQYINRIWHSYHKNKDEYVVTLINKLMNTSALTNSGCTFSWMWKYFQSLINIFLNYIKTDKYPSVIIHNTDEYRAYISLIIIIDSEELRHVIDKQWKSHIKCTSNCTQQYNGSDFLTDANKQLDNNDI